MGAAPLGLYPDSLVEALEFYKVKDRKNNHDNADGDE
jgi:hypothetical protein